MITEDFIQAEYERFCSGKLYFEIIFPDSFPYLYCRGLLTPTRQQVRTAYLEVTDYRQEVLRKWYLGKDKLFRDNLFPHIDTEAGRQMEMKYRVQLVRKMLVFRWYEDQRGRGVNKLFLNLRESRRLSLSTDSSNK